MIILCTITGVCLHWSMISNDKGALNVVIRAALVTLLIQGAIAFIGKALPPAYAALDWEASFGLIYGPLLYIGYRSAVGNVPGKVVIGLHMFPFSIVLSGCAICLAFPGSVQEDTAFACNTILYGAMALSWLIYASYLIYLTAKKETGIGRNVWKDPLAVTVVMLLGEAAFAAVIVYNRGGRDGGQGADMMVPVICLGMFGGIFPIYRYLFKELKKELKEMGEVPLPVPLVIVEKDIGLPKAEYQKSTLKEEVMVAYSERLNSFIESGAYLDVDLSLGKIAAKLKIPKHHLSQLFSQYYKQGFLEHINKLRIQHACTILNGSKENSINIADLAEQCGFKSKPSFYRNFKNITGMTPTEFQNF